MKELSFKKNFYMLLKEKHIPDALEMWLKHWIRIDKFCKKNIYILIWCIETDAWGESVEVSALPPRALSSSWAVYNAIRRASEAPLGWRLQD